MTIVGTRTFRTTGALTALLLLAGCGAAESRAPEIRPATETSTASTGPSANATPAVAADTGGQGVGAIAGIEAITVVAAVPEVIGAKTASAAQAVLAALPVKGRAAMTGYSRELFGQAWADVDRNGCDTRNDVLRRDLRGVTMRPGTNNCVVIAGVLADPYTGKRIAFTKAQASAVQIDHVVALADAWAKGAQGWPATTRLRFANDSLNLLAVDGPANQAKGAGDAATWLPANKAYRCSYVARQVAVKARYRLAVTAAEQSAIHQLLTTCPGQPLPTGGLGSPPPAVGSTRPTPTPTTPPGPAPTIGRLGNPGNSKNCGNFPTWAEANAWFQRYRPYYGDVAHLDGNHDGVPCESLPGAP